MSEQTKNQINLFAILLIVYGGYELLSDIKGIWWSIQRFFYPTQESFWEIAFYSGMTFLSNLLLPIGAIIGGFGLLRLRKWGWNLSITVALFVFTLRCAGSINFIIASYQFRDVPMPAIPEGTHVEYISMIPNYVITVLSVVYILLLNRKPVKNIFIKSN